MKTKRSLLAILAIVFAMASKATEPHFTAIRVDTRTQTLALFLADEKGVPFHRFERLDRWLGKRGKHLRFAMNAGMFHSDYSPVGLLIVDGRQVAPLNLDDGKGNFFLKPNGVFFVDASGPRIVESSKYASLAKGVLLATQSGPLLVEHGAIHPAFDPASKSRYIRNGVGISGRSAIFVISDEPVTFHEFATYFRDRLHCQDALYFDGAVSALWAPDLGREDSSTDLGPMIGVVE